MVKRTSIFRKIPQLHCDLQARTFFGLHVRYTLLLTHHKLSYYIGTKCEWCIAQAFSGNSLNCVPIYRQKSTSFFMQSTLCYSPIATYLTTLIRSVSGVTHMHFQGKPSTQFRYTGKKVVLS